MSKLDISASNVKTRFALHSTLQFKNEERPLHRANGQGRDQLGKGVNMKHFSTPFGETGYKAYLKSPQWREKKTLYKLSGRMFSCWACDKPAPNDYKGFNLHHRTYKNLYEEKLEDFALLCQPHHKELEKMLIELKPYGYTVETWTPVYITLKRKQLGCHTKATWEPMRYL